MIQANSMERKNTTIQCVVYIKQCLCTHQAINALIKRWNCWARANHSTEHKVFVLFHFIIVYKPNNSSILSKRDLRGKNVPGACDYCNPDSSIWLRKSHTCLFILHRAISFNKFTWCTQYLPFWPDFIGIFSHASQLKIWEKLSKAKVKGLLFELKAGNLICAKLLSVL